MKIIDKKYYPWLVVALLWVVALLNYMDRQILSTMQTSMKADIHELNQAEAFGALMAVFLWVYGLVSPFAGMVADKMNRKWLVVGSLFVWSAVTLAMGYATNFDQLYYLRGIMGISEALYIPSALSLLAIGIHMTGIYMGQAVGGFGAVVAAMLSWKTAFQGFGLIGIVYALVLAVLLYEKPSHRQASLENTSTTAPKAGLLSGFGVVLSNWVFWIILFFFAVPSLPGWATKNWLPTLFAQNLGIPMEEAGPISTITIAASSFLGVIFGGYLSDRWVKRNLKGRVYTSAIGLGLTIPALILLGLGHNLPAIVGAGLLFGVGYGMFDANNMPILCQFISAKQRATAYGIMNMTGVFAGAAVTQVLGKWTDGNQLGTGFALLGGIVALALFVQLWFLKPQTDNMV